MRKLSTGYSLVYSLILVFNSFGQGQAQDFNDLCVHQGDKFLVGQSIMLPDYQTRQVVWMTCTRSSADSNPSWVVGTTANYNDGLLEQARHKAITARDLNRLKQETEKSGKTTVQKKAETRILAAQGDMLKKISYSDLDVKQQQYHQKIVSKIQKNWQSSESNNERIACGVSVFNGINGNITQIAFRNCPASETYRASLKTAILKSQPLPLPDIPELYNPQITIVFTPPVD